MMCCDLVAEEAIYHVKCRLKFQSPATYLKCGRPVDSDKEQTFEKLCDWLKVNDFELLTLRDLTYKARALTTDSDFVYAENYLETKLIERYGDHIQFHEVCGRRNVICWKEMGSYIINQKWYGYMEMQYYRPGVM